jgi:hypothetical protein
MNYCLTPSMFYGDRTARTLPRGFFFSVEVLFLEEY